MMRLAAMCCRVSLGVVAFICGMQLLVSCAGGNDGQPAGNGSVQQLDIRGFAYVPESPIRVGDVVRFHAAIFQPDVVSAQVHAAGEGNGELRLDLRDDGLEPDIVAGDHIWTAAVAWPAEIGAGIMAVSLEVQALVGGVTVTDKRLAPWLYVDP